MTWSFQFSTFLASGLKPGPDGSRERQLNICGHPVSLSFGDSNLDGKHRIQISGHGFSSEADARSAGNECRAALLFGSSLNRQNAGLRRAQLKIYQGALLGEMILVARGEVSTPVDLFSKWLADGSRLAPHRNERQTVCAEMISDSINLRNADAAFVVRMSAIEALCAQGELAEEDLKQIADVAETVKANDKLSQNAKDVVVKALLNVKGLTVRAACKGKIKALLEPKFAKTFDGLYGLRSGFVHDGKGRGELHQAAEDSLELAVALLRADLESGTASPPEP